MRRSVISERKWGVRGSMIGLLICLFLGSCSRETKYVNIDVKTIKHAVVASEDIKAKCIEVQASQAKAMEQKQKNKKPESVYMLETFIAYNY